MRFTTAFKRLLRLEGVNVTSVTFGLNVTTVAVALRRRRRLDLPALRLQDLGAL